VSSISVVVNDHSLLAEPEPLEDESMELGDGDVVAISNKVGDAAGE
jgi:hypothetical protein